jgi:YHYH protein
MVLAALVLAALSPAAYAVPATGYWWNPATPGSGFVIEIQGDGMFMAGFLYDVSGRSTWVASSGAMTSPTQYSGNLETFSGGQTLTGSYKTPTQGPNIGAISITFNSDTAGSLTWPGGTIPIQRLSFGPGGATATQPSTNPQNGWWYNPAEGGRGFAIEVQEGSMYFAGYMYDASGNPVWYLSNGNMSSTTLYTGTWIQLGNGITLTGSYVAPTVTNANAGNVTLQFSSATAATLTLPDGRQIPLARYSFYNAGWLVNTSGELSTYFTVTGKPGGAGVPVNVQSVTSTSATSTVASFGIPNYKNIPITSSIYAALLARPQVSTDFVNGRPGVSVGQTVTFGQNIGYHPTAGCTAGNAGFGWWPFGPVCATEQNKSLAFPAIPSPTTDSARCSTGGGMVGLFVNGVSIYNWTDGTSYNNTHTWFYTAPTREVYDVDICPGHAANGDYHHHAHPYCLQLQVNDTGNAHSPIYGYAADGYPLYGPWFSNGQLAQSCWKKRDYSAGSSTGCGTANKRTCLLTSQYNVSAGTVNTVNAGPDTTTTVPAQSPGNNISAASGLFFQDYYWDQTCTAQGGAALDQYNGHTHDNLGYHYHITRTQNADGSFSEAFPYLLGPTLYGKVIATNVNCGGVH